MSEAAPLKNLSQISRAVWRVPSIARGLIQQQEELSHLPSTTDSRTGQPNYDDRIAQTFRVVLWGKGNAVEKSGAKLRPVLREALELAGVQLGRELAGIQQRISDTAQIPPKPNPDDKKDQYQDRKRAWEHKLEAMRETASTLERLIEWIDRPDPEAAAAAEPVQTPALLSPGQQPTNPNPTT